jgi:hypothetical protein
MVNDSNIGGLIGAPVYGPDDHKIGTVGQVFIDPGTGMPNWVTVHTGLFGRRETFVPLNDATWDNEVLRLPVDKDVIKNAPHVDTEAALSPENEAGLYRHYKLLPTTDAGASENEEPHPRLRRYVAPEQAAPAPAEANPVEADQPENDHAPRSPRHAKRD